MKPQVPDELISAYFDGEASPEERAAVERLLASSDDAQRELSETAKLSALLHSFPRESAPADMIANVLRQTEQIATPVPSTTVSTTAPVRNVWRDWAAGLMGAAVSATAIGLIIALNSSSTERAELHLAKESAPAGGTSIAGLEMKNSTPMVAMDDSVSNLHLQMKSESANIEQAEVEAIHSSAKQDPSQPMQMPAPRAALKSRGPAMPAIAADMAPPPSPVADTAPAEEQAVINELGQTNEEFLQSVSKGEVVALMPKAADPNSNVAVVYLEVVDINRCADQIQVLLKKNAITQRSFKKEGQAAPDDFIVIYLEAPGEKLANTLKDVDRHRDLFTKWSPQAPLQLAANNDEATQMVRKKQSTGREAAGNQEKPAGAKDSKSNLDSEMPDVEIVLDALVQRNGYLNGVNPGFSDLAGQSNNGRDGNEALQRQQIANTARGMNRNESYSRNVNPVANGQLRELARVEPGYDFVRMNNTTVLNNSYASNGLNLPQSNAGSASLSRGTAQRVYEGNSDAEKPMAKEMSTGALRMLFVLHPPVEGNQTPPAAAPVSPEAEPQRK